MVKETDMPILKFIWKCEGTRMPTTVLRKTKLEDTESQSNQDSVVLAEGQMCTSMERTEYPEINP